MTPPPAGFTVLGIDVSSHDHSRFPIDWPAVAASGVEFAYVKATEGTTYLNPYFHSDNAAAKDAGLLVGAYVFGRPDKPNPVEQAEWFLSKAEWSNDSRTLIPFLDLEWPYFSGVNDCYNLTPAQMVSWIRAFVDHVKARIGRDMMIYTNPNWWNPCTGNNTSFGNNPLDISKWSTGTPTVLPSGWNTFTVWQYAPGNNSVAGDYDKDAFNGDYAALTRLTGSAPAMSEPFALRAHANNRFVTAENAGKSALIANRTTTGVWEQYDMVDAGDGFVAFRSHANGLYVTAENAGASPLIANRSTIGGWEKFRVIDNPDGSISLLANANGRYVTAENAGASPLIADRTSAGTWEKFARVKLPSVLALSAQASGRYVTAENAGASPLIANRTSVGKWEQYDMVDAGDGFVAFRSHANGLYVTAENAGAAPLIANRSTIGGWEKFRIIDNPDGSISLLANANGRYVIADNAGASPLIANSTAVGTWEKFIRVSY